MDQASILSFVAITILLIVTPGADMALISRAAMRKGQLGALSAMIGINCASVIWTFLAAVGFVAVVSAIPYANKTLMLIGALYMGYVGYKDVKSGLAARKVTSGISGKSIDDESYYELFKKGFLVNISNPKIGLYYATVLPNFLSTDMNHGKYIVLMGMTHNVLGFCWFMLFAFLLIKGTNVFGSSGSRSSITLLTGLALILFSFIALYFVFQDFT